jgi:hypothetical protein
VCFGWVVFGLGFWVVGLKSGGAGRVSVSFSSCLSGGLAVLAC